MKKLLCVLFILILMLSCASCGASSYERVVDTYIQASFEGDAKKILSLMPDSFVDCVVEEEFEGDKEEMIYELEDMLDELVDMLEEYEIDLKTISYEIVYVQDMEFDDIDDIEDEYRKADLDIKEGKEVKVELKIPINGEERTNSMYIDIVKIGTSWYLIGM